MNGLIRRSDPQVLSKESEIFVASYIYFSVPYMGYLESDIA